MLHEPLLVILCFSLDVLLCCMWNVAILTMMLLQLIAKHGQGLAEAFLSQFCIIKAGD